MFNLLDLLIEQVLEEGKDPVELIKYKYQNVPEEIIDSILSIDPTKKKSYTRWVLQFWDDESELIEKAVENNQIQKIFQNFRDNQDIQANSFKSFEEALRTIPEEDTVLTKFNTPTQYIENLGKEVDSRLANDFDIVYDDEDWLIAIPHTYEADCKLGENSYWCTTNARGNGLTYYNNYLNGPDDVYYVNFDKTQSERRNGKDYPYKRYQFHFNSHQFMDLNDDPIKVEEVVPQKVIDFYEERGEDVTDFEDLETRYEHYSEQRYNDSLYLGNIHGSDDFNYTILPEFNDDYRIGEDPNYYIYNDDDDRDPVDWSNMKSPDEYNVETDFIPIKFAQALLLKDYHDDWILLTAIKSERRWGHDDELSSTIICWDINETLQKAVVLDKNGTIYLYNGNEVANKYSIDDRFFEDDKIFINPYVTDPNGSLFIELIASSDGVHYLYKIEGDNITNIINDDAPANGKYYISDKDGAIECVSYTHYVIDGVGSENNSNETRYSLVRHISDNVWLVNVLQGEDIKQCLYNANNKNIIGKIFGTIKTEIPELKSLIVTNEDTETNGQTLIDINVGVVFEGDIIDFYGTQENPVFCCKKNNDYYIFYLDTKKIITADILKGVNGRPANTIIGSKNNIDFLFDTNKRKIVCTSKNISFPRTYIQDFKNKYVVVTDENDITSLVLSENPQDVLITNIQKMDFPSYQTNFTVFFTNNKIMAYDINSLQKLLPVFADKEIHLGETATGYLTSNGIYFLSNSTNALLLDRPLNPNYSTTHSNGFCYKDQDLHVEVYTNRYAKTAYFFIRQTGKHAQNYDSIEEIPEDIRNRVYNLIFGNTTTPQQIQENFRKIYNRFFKN